MACTALDAVGRYHAIEPDAKARGPFKPPLFYSILRTAIQPPASRQVADGCWYYDPSNDSMNPYYISIILPCLARP